MVLLYIPSDAAAACRLGNQEQEIQEEKYPFHQDLPCMGEHGDASPNASSLSTLPLAAFDPSTLVQGLLCHPVL